MEEEARLKLEVAHSIELDLVCILFVRLDCTSPERRLYDTGAIAFNSTLLHPLCSAGFVHPPGMLGRVSGIFCARSLLGGFKKACSVFILSRVACYYVTLCNGK